MPYYDKRHPNSWYESLPVEPANMPNNPYIEHPLDHFDINKLKENFIELGSGEVLVKIPKIEKRIYLRKSEQDRNEIYVEYLVDRYYDKEKKQMSNKKVIIGRADSAFRGMMIINDQYYNYFYRTGEVLYDPMKKREEEKAEKAWKAQQAKEAREKAKKEALEKQRAEEAARKDAMKETEQAVQAEKGDKRTVEEIREELLRKEKLIDEGLAEIEELKQKLEKRQKELDHMITVRQIELTEAEKEHLALLDKILYQYILTVKEQAKSRPDAPMRLRQVQMINKLLEEIREYLTGCETDDYFALAEEPGQENGEKSPGTTYGEMTLQLSAYDCSIEAFRMGTLYFRGNES